MSNTKKKVVKGWVIACKDGFIQEFTFQRTRVESIAEWMNLWDKKRVTWSKFKRQGYGAFKSKQTTEIE